jgi:hypothetical protein
MATKKSEMALKSATPLPYTLRSIYLRSCETRMADAFDPLIPGQPLTGVFRNIAGEVDCRETTLEVEGVPSVIRSCTFKSTFDFAYTSPNVDGEVASEADIENNLLARISAEIAVDYSFNGDTFPDAAELQKWASTNVVLHAWPYWREFCHSTMLRMNLPVTMIPLVQFNQDQANK